MFSWLGSGSTFLGGWGCLGGGSSGGSGPIGGGGGPEGRPGGAVRGPWLKRNPSLLIRASAASEGAGGGVLVSPVDIRTNKNTFLNPWKESQNIS